LRIALSLRAPFSGAPARLDPQVRAAVERIADRLTGLGHEVARADPTYGLVGASFMPRSMAGVHRWAERVPDHSLLDPRTRNNARTGRFLGGPVLKAARALELPLQLQVGRIFRNFDVVLMPTTATPPPRAGVLEGLGGWETDKAIVAACPYAWVWNVLGWPGVNVPIGLTEDGLPLGAQLLGAANDEARLIGLAVQLESVENWHERRPPPLARAVVEHDS
ncbi:MAG: amidase, partial [Solirubrobacterales bacterium]|nr:amidase [Solirubrobacterales bacterium]